MKHTITLATFAVACLAGSAAYAGPSKAAKKIVEPMQESCITGNIGFDVVSNYVTKGIVQNNQGFIIQPYADLHFRIYKGDGPLTSVTADIGIWNSFHGHSRRGVTQTTPNWYEFDFQAGLTANFNKLALGGYFKVYESPNSTFRNDFAIGISIAYDDSDALGAFALHPYAFSELNVQGTTGNGAGTGSTPNQYYEVGIAPAHSWGDLTLSLPIKGGFGSGGFYLGNRGFGFVSVGVNASYALNFVPACLGKWSINSGVTYLRLGGDNTLPGLSGASGNGDFTRPLGGGPVDKNQLVFQGGMKVAF